MVLADEHHPEQRRVEDRLQLGSSPVQFPRPFRHLRLELIAGLAEPFFPTASLVDEPCTLECCRRLIRRNGEKHLVDFGGKVGATACRGDEAAIGVDSDGNDETTAPVHVVAEVLHDLLL